MRNVKIPKAISSVLFVKKPGDEKVSSALGDIVRYATIHVKLVSGLWTSETRYMQEVYPHIRLFGEPTAELPLRLPSWTPQGEDDLSVHDT